MVERIRTLLESRQLTPTQFADLIGVARPTVSHILSGRNKPSLEVVQRILAAMPELAMPWLLNGSGPMLTAADASGFAVVPAATAPVSSPPVVPVLPATQAAAEVPTVEPSMLGQPSDKQYNGAPTPGVDAPVLSAGDLVGKQTVKVAESASRGSKPAPFKLALSKPVAMPKRFVAAPVAPAAPASIGEPDVALRREAVEPPVAVPPIVVVPEQAAASVLAAPLIPTQVPSVADSGPGVTDKAPESAMAQALFAGAEKPIRRIVIFYRDGSFADYQPE